MCDNRLTKDIDKMFWVFRVLLSCNLFNIILLNVELSIVKKPFAHGREWWGSSNCTAGRVHLLQRVEWGGVGVA